MNDGEKKQMLKKEAVIAGNELVDYIKRIIAEGNVRRIIIRKGSGEVLMEVPLTAGLAVSGALTIMAPVFAALGAMAALVAQFKVEIVRSDEDPDS